jgi:iron complex outermembrane receptor protein
LAFDLKPTTTSSVALSLFRYWWDDIILFVQETGSTTRIAQNAGKQTGYGLELDAHWQPTRALRLLGNYAYQRSTDERTDEDAGNAPHHQVYLRADWEFLPDWHLNPQLNWVIDRDRVAGDTRPRIDDYSTVDVVVRAEHVKRHWELALSVRNLFDTDMREPSPPGSPVAPIPNDLPLAGRRFLAEMRWHF